MDQGESYPSALRAWYVCGVMLLAAIFAYMDRSIVALLVVPIEQELGISDTQMSLVQGFSFVMLFALLGLPLSRIVDSRSRRGVIGAGIAVWSVMTAACGAATGFWHLFLARVGVGVGEATLLPGSASLLADYFPPRRRALAQALFFTGIYLGTGCGLVAGGALFHALSGLHLELPGFGPIHSWRLVFVAVGLPGLLIAALMLTVREVPRLGMGAHSRAPQGRRAGLPLSQVGAYYRANRATLLCHNLGFTLLTLALTAASAWIPTIYARLFGWSTPQIGVRFGLLALVLGPTSAVAGGVLCHWLEARGYRDGKLRVALIAALGALPTGLAFPLMRTPLLSFVLLVPFFFCVNLVWGPASAALQDIMPNQMRGQAAAIYNGVTNLVAAGVGPTSVSLLSDYVFRSPMGLNWGMAVVVPISCLAAALLFRLGGRPYLATLDRIDANSRATGTVTPA